MKVLITAGSTQSQIDQVRVLTNIFHGRTGYTLAHQFSSFGHEVMLLTSDPNIWENPVGVRSQVPYLVRKFKTFDQLAILMEEEIRNGGYDVIIHSAAVSDYKVEGVYTNDDGNLNPVDSGSKISSQHGELYLRLVPTFKIVDKIRSDWGFSGELVKFKLQVGISDEELIEIAKRSRVTSDADIIVANCLEWARDYAYVIGRDSIAKKVARNDIGLALFEILE